MTMRVHGCNCVRRDVDGDASPTGGVCLSTSNLYPSNVVTLHTSLQAVAVRIHIRSLVTVYCEGSDKRMIERELQTAVNNIVKCCDTNGHSISASKSCCVHFCHKRGILPDPEIRIRDVQIPVVPDVRFLGVIFDRRLTFLPHILHLRKRCEKSLNLLKVL
ncbi:putative RNA-directed DNA polymerase from transposon X-element [Trichonephila clavipes]|nr:putative RNA-directed DNA polymerase from transposon X-element [Trichonephila clavipes]